MLFPQLTQEVTGSAHVRQGRCCAPGKLRWDGSDPDSSRLTGPSRDVTRRPSRPAVAPYGYRNRCSASARRVCSLDDVPRPRYRDVARRASQPRTRDTAPQRGSSRWSPCEGRQSYCALRGVERCAACHWRSWPLCCARGALRSPGSPQDGGTVGGVSRAARAVHSPRTARAAPRAWARVLPPGVPRVQLSVNRVEQVLHGIQAMSGPGADSGDTSMHGDGRATVAVAS